MARRRVLAVVVGLVLITAAACGDDDDADPSDGGYSDDTFEEEVPLSDEELDAQNKADTQAQMDQYLTGHIVTLPDGSTVRCVVSSYGENQLECAF